MAKKRPRREGLQRMLLFQGYNALGVIQPVQPEKIREETSDDKRSKGLLAPLWVLTLFPIGAAVPVGV